MARAYFAEAIGLARALDDRWRLSQILAWQAYGATLAGDPIAARAAGEEGRDLADAIGDRFDSRQCRFCLGVAQMYQGDLAGAAAQFGEWPPRPRRPTTRSTRVPSLAASEPSHWHTRVRRARPEPRPRRPLRAPRSLAGGSRAFAHAALVRGPGRRRCCSGARARREAIGQHLSVPVPQAAALRAPECARPRWQTGIWSPPAAGPTRPSRRRPAGGCMLALTTRARVAIAQASQSRPNATPTTRSRAPPESRRTWAVPDILECLAALAGQDGSHREAARLFGAAQSIRQRMGAVRFKIYDAGYEASVAALRDALGEQDFDAAWAEGAALSTEEAIAYAQRGRGERKRPTSGWASLTPTERDVVRLVSDGLGNKDIATRLFVSPRTVQTHLTHVYTKLGLTSRVQLAQEAARHT